MGHKVRGFSNPYVNRSERRIAPSGVRVVRRGGRDLSVGRITGSFNRTKLDLIIIFDFESATDFRAPGALVARPGRPSLGAPCDPTD
jgi:hypothetical protein